MPPELVFTSDAASAINRARRGWDDFDRYVLWAAGRRPQQTLRGVAQMLPEGVDQHLIRRSLDLLAAQGLVCSRRVLADPRASLAEIQVVWVLTEAGESRLNRAETRKAA